MGTEDNFKINSSYQGFSERQKNVFDQLKTLEKESNIPKVPPVDLRSKLRRKTTTESDSTPPGKAMKQYKRKESIFKKPHAPINRCLPMRRLPDHYKNPQNWTKYSLDDVRDMSDKINTQAAMSFLRELQDRKQMDVDDAEDKDLPAKITFNRKASRPKAREPESKVFEVVAADEKVSFRSSKVVMPEYIVGQSKPKEKKNRPVKDETNMKELKLDHLQEYDDDDDDKAE